ncbi:MULTISPECIES: helix-turn-helix domain-containing protein [unclassified Pseudomonas]|uniref:helix-turn-helix domain-containing protein n=1 Tax=unclassified Pseudomonas TaxID=196821 RepID=UPI0008393482|nr:MULTISPECIES: helix-turn-helix domain-containing protein [unclassified Pseudomonas]QIH08477.1 helix-turn-helix domain-containing protein [Pseudomonas sp. BIOMIG1BAC]UMZ14619.1 helix-turn-helix domain-containing protein [Pseudomonas sp. MPFS]
MFKAFYSVDEAAARLQLHPKTVLRFIREGRLPATRVGRAYRIAHARLQVLAGEPEQAPARAGQAKVTSVVDIPGASIELQQYLARGLQAALAAPGQDVVHLQTLLDPTQDQLKVVLVAPPGTAAALLGLLDRLLQNYAP